MTFLSSNSGLNLKEKVIYQRIRMLVFLLVFVFLLMGYASADVTEILTPAAGDQLVSGRANPVIIDINWSQLTVSVARYKLSYRTGVYDDWKVITNRYCRTSGECSDSNPCCSTLYPWEVPSVGKNKYNCQLKITFFDLNGNKIAKKTSSAFTILSHGSAHPLSISPRSRTVAPGGVDYYWVTYGQPPYVIDTSEHAITTAYEGSVPNILPIPPVTINSNIFYVKNLISTCPDNTDIKVTVVVTDANSYTATAEYIIDCTP